MWNNSWLAASSLLTICRDFNTHDSINVHVCMYVRMDLLDLEVHLHTVTYNIIKYY